VKISEKGNDKVDESLKRFLFMLKNPHNVWTRRFVLKDEKEGEAICCDSEDGPVFSDGVICDNYNTNTSSFPDLGGSYTTTLNWSGHSFHGFKAFPSPGNQSF
jgi:hypothetical protein